MGVEAMRICSFPQRQKFTAPVDDICIGNIFEFQIEALANHRALGAKDAAIQFCQPLFF